MGTLQQVLWILLLKAVAVLSFWSTEDAMFPQEVQGVLDNNWILPFEGNLDFPSFDTIFSSWQKWTPDFHMLADFPPTMQIPEVQVFCDETKLTLVVDKKAFGLKLTAEEIQLGNGCYSNKEQLNHLIFIYNLDECGTTPVLQNGLQAFTNSLYLNFKETQATSWQAFSKIQISCIPNRFHKDIKFFQTSSPEKSFEMQAMNPSWTQMAESNVYKRGLVVRLQVSAEAKLGQQLFIRSCFVSASRERQIRPRHAVILNKGCASSMGSPHTVAQFAATNGPNVVNFMLNTSYLIAELYVHCSVVLSAQGVSAASKSCNYNVTGSRWEEVNGNAEVCTCCSSKCKGQSVKNLPNEAIGVVNFGPIIIVDDWELSPALPDSKPLDAFGSALPTTMMANTHGPEEDAIVPAASMKKAELQPVPQGILVVRQEPTARLTAWLPEPLQGENLIPNLPVKDVYSVEEVSTMHGNSLNHHTNEIAPAASEKRDSSDWGDKLDMLVDGWQIPQEENQIYAQDFQKRGRYGRSGNSDEAIQRDVSFPPEINVNIRLVENSKRVLPDATEEEIQTNWSPADFLASEKQTDAAMEPHEFQPIIRTKLEFSKSADGSRKLSYEEVKQQERRDAEWQHPKDDLKKRPVLKGLRSTFLDLLRRMDKEE